MNELNGLISILFLCLQEDAPSESGNQDAHSTSSEMLDQLLQEDARSGTGSNASGSGSGESGGSLGSGSGLCSNGTSSSHTGAVQNLSSMTLNVVWKELCMSFLHWISIIKKCFWFVFLFCFVLNFSLSFG